MTAIKPILLGCEGLALTVEERAAFACVNPLGFILFQRNCADPDQVRALTAALRESVGRADAPIFIDQEGGRVARLKPPHWLALPPARALGLLAERDLAAGLEASRLHASLTAAMLRAVGIDGNCAPVLDLLIEGASSAIGDRAFSRSPDIIAQLGRASVEAYRAGGIMPVIKHCPGHGRVLLDPHADLPFVDTPLEVLSREDFASFRALADAPFAMNCHVVYRAIDPDNPASLSAVVHEKIIRGAIGFKGLLMTDDLAMGALKMPLPERVRRAFAAGADIALYCTGSLSGLEQIAPILPVMDEMALSRFAAARALCAAQKNEALQDTAALHKKLMERIA